MYVEFKVQWKPKKKKGYNYIIVKTFEYLNKSWPKICLSSFYFDFVKNTIYTDRWIIGLEPIILNQNRNINDSCCQKL